MTAWAKIVVAAGAVALVGSSIGLAAASTRETSAGTDTRIIGCVDRDSKAVRIVQRTARCRDAEDVVTWNRSGPQGATGPRGATGLRGLNGPVGPVGPTGPQGAVGAAGADGKTIGYFAMQPTSPAPAALAANRPTVIVTIPDVAIGTYQGTVSTIITTDGLPRGIDVSVYCRVVDQTTKPSRDLNFFALPNRWATVSGQFLVRVDTDGTDVSLRCQGDPATLVDTRMSMVKVTN